MESSQAVPNTIMLIDGQPVSRHEHKEYSIEKYQDRDDSKDLRMSIWWYHGCDELFSIAYEHKVTEANKDKVVIGSNEAGPGWNMLCQSGGYKDSQKAYLNTVAHRIWSHWHLKIKIISCLHFSNLYTHLGKSRSTQLGDSQAFLCLLASWATSLPNTI